MSLTKKIIIICVVAGVVIPGYFFTSMFLEHKVTELPAANVLIFNIVLNIVFTLLVTGMIATVNLVFIKRFLNRKYPWHVNNVKRVVFELLGTNLTSIFLIIIFSLILYHLYPENVRCQLALRSAIFKNIVIAVIVNNIVAPVYEAQYLFREWVNSRIETEQLKREKAESQYKSLRDQINPHFLFNSLNTLLTMVAENPKASQYVESLSDFLRNVLQAHDKEAVFLHEELKMANQYIFIQKTRFGDKLIVETSIPPDYLDYALPSFALQILLENAIKHNVVSKEYPLKIKVYVADDYLVVENNIRRKSEENPSTGIGLNNIVNRFRYLSARTIKINDEGGKFKVSLPLLKMSL